jgi:hypothetical protein
MPRNAFASIEDWDRSVLSATTRVCDSYQLFNDADGSPAFVNGIHSAPVAGPWQRQTPDDGYDCYCTNIYTADVGHGGPGYSGYVGDGMARGGILTQHVAQYAYSWVPTIAPEPPGNIYDVASDSVWVGSSGLFHNGTEVLQQTGIQDWEMCHAVSDTAICYMQDALFYECI